MQQKVTRFNRKRNVTDNQKIFQIRGMRMKAVAYYHMSIWKTVDIFRICKKLHILVEEPFILYGIDGFLHLYIAAQSYGRLKSRKGGKQ